MNSEALLHAGVDKAHVIVITLQNDLLTGTSNEGIIESVRKMNPSATIIASATEYREITSLYEKGADFVYLAHVETARGLVPAISDALEGKIRAYKAGREAFDGALHERSGFL